MGCTWEDRCGPSFGRRLTTLQRAGLLATVALLLALNILYVVYAVRQMQHAQAHPASSVAVEGWGANPFPPFVVSTVARTWDPLHVPGADACPVLNYSCTSTRANWYNHAWPDSPVSCQNNGQFVYVPSAAWISPNAPVQDPNDPNTLYTSSALDIVLLHNASAPCKRLMLVVLGSTDPDAQWVLTDPLGIPVGHSVLLFMAASGDRDTNGNTVYRPQQTGFMDLGPIPPGQSPLSGPPGTPTVSTRIYLDSGPVQTSPNVEVRAQTVTYTPLDAIAAVIAVLNVSLTILVGVFPNTPLVRHARLWFLSAERYTRDLPNDHAAAALTAAAAPGAAEPVNRPGPADPKV